MLRILSRFSNSYYHNPSTIPFTYKTISEQLKLITNMYPDNLAVVSQLQDYESTYAEFYKQCEQLAGAFVNLGLQKGDRIGIFSPNNYEWVLTQFAAAMADLILVNINPAYQTTELKYALNKVQCKALIMRSSFRHSNYVSMIRELAPEIKHPGTLNSQQLPHLKTLVLIDDHHHKQGFYSFKELFDITNQDGINEAHNRMSHQNPDDITNIQFTSGTTGSPKGAALSHFNILNNAKYVGARVNYTDKDRVCNSVPLYHCFGMVMGNLACINYGAAMVFPSDGFSAAAALEAVTNYKCTSLYGVPTMFYEYVSEYQRHPHKYNLSTLRTGLIAGSLASEQLMRNIINVLGIKEISNCYGQTETSPITCQTKVDDPLEIKVTTVGSPLNVEVKIIDSDTGKTVPLGQVGEYCVRGYSVMKQYWDDEKATSKAIDSDGYIHSGDQATMDEHGNVSIVGRIKDMIIRGGENVYPKEIEDYLSQMPGVEMVQVVGCKDEKFGEEIVALIKMKADIEDELTGLDVYEFCHHKIAHYKIPKYVKFVTEFPFTITGKPQKFKMRDQIDKELEDPKMQELYQIRR